jgi:ribosomal protein S27AE
MPPVTGADCPLCGRGFVLHMHLGESWRGYWFGCCSSGHRWYGIERAALTRIVGLRAASLCSGEPEVGERACERCGIQITFLIFQTDYQFACPKCRWTVPKDLLPRYLQMCPQCGKVSDTFVPPPRLVGYVWKCESGHVFGGTYPTLTPCNCWTEGKAGLQRKESQQGTWVVRCSECGSVLEEPNDALRKRMRDAVRFSPERSGSEKGRAGSLWRLWRRVLRT